MKYYIRKGRRFVEVESKVGMYYNKDGTFTSTKFEDSIGICVIDDFKKIVVASICKAPFEMNWDNANKFCKTISGGRWHLPSLEELLIATKIDTFDWNDSILWISTQYRAYYAYCWPSSLTYGSRYGSCVVVPFLTLYK